MPSVPSQPDLGPKRVDQKPGSQALQSPAGARGVFRKPGIDAPNAGFPKVTVKAGEMPSQQVRPPQVDVVSTQIQQSERRVPFEDRFSAGVRTSFDGKYWVSTGGRDHVGRLIFRPEGGGGLRVIDAATLQAKGAFPLEQEARVEEATSGEYHVHLGQDVYVLRSSGKIEKGWKVEYFDADTGKITVKSADRKSQRVDPRRFIDDLNRPTAPEDIMEIDFGRARTPLERRERIMHVVRRLKDGGLRGSKGFYRNDQLANELQALLNHPSQDDLNLLPNTGGLREKVKELLNMELAEQRLRENS